MEPNVRPWGRGQYGKRAVNIQAQEKEEWRGRESIKEKGTEMKGTKNRKSSWGAAGIHTLCSSGRRRISENELGGSGGS